VASTFGWSNSSDFLVRAVPQTRVLPIAVSGVISKTAYQHRIARRFTDPKEREWAAATLQVLCWRFRDTQTRVAIGEPMAVEHLTDEAGIDAAMAPLLAVVGRRHEGHASVDHAFQAARRVAPALPGANALLPSRS
jgi:hypothetical protein